MLRVGLNLVFLTPGHQGGMEVYARELLPRLAAIGDLDLTVFVGRGAAGIDWGAELHEVVVPVTASDRKQWVIGEQLHLPRLARAAGCELVHSLASTAPLWGRFRRVTTIHDLNYRMVEDAHFGVRGLGMRALVPAAARRSDRVIADSRHTAADLVRHLHVDEGRIDVAPLAVSPPPPLDPGAAARVRAELGLGDRPVVLSLSAKRPHKNIGRLLEGLAAIDAPERPVLVIPGYPTPFEAELRAQADALGVAGDVRWPAWISAADLEALYGAATCVVFPSLYEGFGLPILEAMVRGVPVACSDRSSLPEVAGGAALLFDPEDPGAIRSSMQQLLADDALRRRLVAAGSANAATFTWERTAELTAASYRAALA